MSENKKILIVEDDLYMQGAVADALSELGYEVETCDNGQEALNTLREDNFDLVISDVQMTPISGVELILQKRKESLPPIILMTGNPNIADEHGTSGFGAVGMLPKPFNIKDLKKLVDKAFSED